MLNLLGLSKDWMMLDTQEVGADRVIVVELRTYPSHCPWCQQPRLLGDSARPRLVRCEKKQRFFHDMPLYGQRIGLAVIHRRYLCHGCGRRFWESLPDIDQNFLSTERLVSYVRARCLRQPFVDVAEETGISDRTARRMCSDLWERQLAAYQPRAAIVIGLDGVHLARRKCCVITDLSARKVIDLLPASDMQTLTAFFSALPGRERIEVAVMDMHFPYRRVITSLFPNAQIVVDRFHLAQLIGACLIRLRGNVRAQLSSQEQKSLLLDRHLLFRRRRDLEARDLDRLDRWRRQLPVLAEAYQNKENFLDIWEAETRTQALALYTAWQQSLSADLLPTFRPVIDAVSLWHSEVFGFFDARYTNGFTEAINRQLKEMSERGRGFSYATIRAKLLLTQEQAQARRPTFRRS